MFYKMTAKFWPILDYNCNKIQYRKAFCYFPKFIQNANPFPKIHTLYVFEDYHDWTLETLEGYLQLKNLGSEATFKLFRMEGRALSEPKNWSKSNFWQKFWQIIDYNFNNIQYYKILCYFQKSSRMSPWIDQIMS